MSKKAIVVGSGIVGAVLAHELAEKGQKVEIWEKRDHIGGNLYDYTDEHGIHVHRYGPHIFHTNSESVWEYVNRFCEFEKYNLVCGAVLDGKCVPTTFDFTSVDTFFPDEADIIKEHIKSSYGSKTSATVLELLNSQDKYIKKFAQFLYDKDYAPYTAKQWGIAPEEVDKDIFKRVPIMLSYGSGYFTDKYQAMPKTGYMELINNLVDHVNIEVKTKTDALNHISINASNNQLLIDGEETQAFVYYTGPLDELFNCRFGRLPYRSLKFEWKYDEIDSFQEMPVVAYPQAEEYTRITEYKKLPYQNVIGTTYAVEYPISYEEGTAVEPYYPVLTDQSKELYRIYRDMAEKIQNLVCCGRLADFKYYNMDQAIEMALKMHIDI